MIAVPAPKENFCRVQIRGPVVDVINDECRVSSLGRAVGLFESVCCPTDCVAADGIITTSYRRLMILRNLVDVPSARHSL